MSDAPGRLHGAADVVRNSDVVRKTLQGEVGKDLAKRPVYEIEKQLLRPGAG